MSFHKGDFLSSFIMYLMKFYWQFFWIQIIKVTILAASLAQAPVISMAGYTVILYTTFYQNTRKRTLGCILCPFDQASHLSGSANELSLWGASWLCTLYTLGYFYLALIYQSGGVERMMCGLKRCCNVIF